MTGTHNKRGKAAAVRKKERKARAHGGGGGQGQQRSHRGGPSHFRHQHGYLSFFTEKKQNAYQSISTNVDPLDAQLFDYLIVVDVEGTCERDADHFPSEIIEFPAILVDVRCGLVLREKSFHTYVKPVRHPTLTAFCTELTGITQEQVDDAPTLPEAVEKFTTWFTNTIPVGARVMFCADGPWDFGTFFYKNHVLRDGISLPLQFYEYLDIRTSFTKHFGSIKFRSKLRDLIRHAGLRFEGREHCGFDDAYNIGRLAVKLMRSGCVLDFLVCLPLEGAGHTLDATHGNHNIHHHNSHSGGVDNPHDKDAVHRTSSELNNQDHHRNNNSNTVRTGSAGGNRGPSPRYYTIPGFPVYRREEGSGPLDRDVVEDIAKKAFGQAYFEFGEKHEKEVWEYRKEHSSQFNVHRSLILQRRARRVRWGWWKIWMRRIFLLLLICLLLLLLVVLVITRL